MSDPIAIRFIRSSLPYVAGEIAWFNEIQAAAYIKQGFAERVRNPTPYVPAASRTELLAKAELPTRPVTEDLHARS